VVKLWWIAWQTWCAERRFSAALNWDTFFNFIFTVRIDGPAGRARYARRGHFVACVPFPGRLSCFGPPDCRDQITLISIGSQPAVLTTGSPSERLELRCIILGEVNEGSVMSNVLVLFQTDCEYTEQMALAVAVGAVEAEGNIRLRRLATAFAVDVVHKGYGKLQQADLLWADTVVAGLESETPRAEELAGLLQLLSELDPGELNGKQAWTFGPDGLVAGQTEAQIFVESALRVAGFMVIPAARLESGPADGMTEKMKEAGRLSGRR
jgi:hypothetical protein